MYEISVKSSKHVPIKSVLKLLAFRFKRNPLFNITVKSNVPQCTKLWLVNSTGKLMPIYYFNFKKFAKSSTFFTQISYLSSHICDVHSSRKWISFLTMMMSLSGRRWRTADVGRCFFDIKTSIVTYSRSDFYCSTSGH